MVKREVNFRKQTENIFGEVLSNTMKITEYFIKIKIHYTHLLLYTTKLSVVQRMSWKPSYCRACEGDHRDFK